MSENVAFVFLGPGTSFSVISLQFYPLTCMFHHFRFTQLTKIPLFIGAHSHSSSVGGHPRWFRVPSYYE